MQKETSDHEKRRHWKLVHRSETKGAKPIMTDLVLQAQNGQHHWKGEKIQSQNLCARWNARKRNKLLGNICPSSAMDER